MSVADNVAYTILALSRFYDTFQDPAYLDQLNIAFNWLLGKNHLHQIMYNPCTGGCYDGLEEKHINLNQGAESTVSYLLARLTVEKYLNPQQKSETFREYEHAGREKKRGLINIGVKSLSLFHSPV